MGKGPLDHPRLLAVDERLDDGKLDEAQQLMAEIGDVGFFRYATTYLATRLLYQRGRLDAAGVAERLRELLQAVDYFPEARAMLEAAETGTLDRVRCFKACCRQPSVPSGDGRAPASEPALELGTTSSLHDRAPGAPVPEIPRAGRVPELGASFGETPLPVLPDLDPPPSSQGSAAALDAPEITIRSGPPPALELPRTLFEIAALLDAGQPELALEELARDDLNNTPEVALMQARAFAQLGCDEEADELIDRLASAPLLDPELRAGVARLLVERGSPHAALDQARHAHNDDPEPAMVRLSLAWAAVRALAHGGEPALASLAQALLSRLRTRSGPRPALVLGLRARLLAAGGEAERAVSLARRALELDPRCADALAALAIGSARLEHGDEALEAWRLLHATNAAEAAVMAPALGALGIAVPRS
jgi:tetratricopeptide (TPR) repeat protein